MASLKIDSQAYSAKQLDEYRVKRYSRCIVLYTRSLHKSHDKSICYDLATLNYRKGDYERAIKKYNLVSVIKPDFQLTYNGWGSCLYQLGRYDEAILKFNKTLEIDPNYALSYLNLGLILLWQKKKEKAERLIEEGIRRTVQREALIITLYKFDLTIVEERLEKASSKEERESLIWRIAGYNRMLELIPKFFEKKANGMMISPAKIESKKKKNVFLESFRWRIFVKYIWIFLLLSFVYLYMASRN